MPKLLATNVIFQILNVLNSNKRQIRARKILSAVSPAMHGVYLPAFSNVYDR